MKNITVCVTERSYREARVWAAERETSLSRVVQYLITTLQLDSPDLALYRASRDDTINRFKLRVRVYDSVVGGPVFMEVKRKIKGVVVKSRCRIPSEFWGPQLFERRKRQVPPFRTHKERSNFIEFVRLTEMINARPVMLIRYVRESYMGANDLYARVTIDRRLCYSPTRTWELPPAERRWRSMDSSAAMGRPYSGAILELKTYRDTPLWMVELTERFNLVRAGY